MPRRSQHFKCFALCRTSGRACVLHILTYLLLALALPAAAQSPTVNDLFDFTAPNGAIPTAGLIQAKDGSLYGTSVWGGANGSGTVFKISTSGSLTTLYSFTGGGDGSRPAAGLIQAKDGNLYGTTSQGGA